MGIVAIFVWSAVAILIFGLSVDLAFPSTGS